MDRWAESENNKGVLVNLELFLRRYSTFSDGKKRSYIVFIKILKLHR